MNANALLVGFALTMKCCKVWMRLLEKVGRH
jgi:hypothetical protein